MSSLNLDKKPLDLNINSSFDGDINY